MPNQATVNVGGEYQQPTGGSTGAQTQVGGQATTVSSVAGATGGIAAGNLVQTDIDTKLFKFKSDQTPLMQLMLYARKQQVKSPVVQHFVIDEPKSFVTTNSKVTKADGDRFVLPLVQADKNLPRPFTTLLVKGVDGYAEDGKTVTPGEELMLFIIGKDTTSGNPLAIAVNGPRATPTDEACTTPEIPAGTECVLMANACYETQKEVDPDLIVPQPVMVYLQKRVMNTVVSDYFEAQEKLIPFSQALIAEAQITNFKVKGNRTLYGGVRGKIKVDTGKMGVQDIYFTDGVRRQVKKEIEDDGEWSYRKFIALSKLIYTGEDVPKKVIGLCGKNFLEKIQCIDFSDHPEVTIDVKLNDLGWEVSRIHTTFGDLEFKHDPALDRLQWSNSCLILAYDRLVHYVYSAEHNAKDRVEGHEATRKATIVWDGLGLKGTCHIWINGEGRNGGTSGVRILLWNDTEKPATPKENAAYYLMKDVPGIDAAAKAGSIWQYKDSAWAPYDGEIHLG